VDLTTPAYKSAAWLAQHLPEVLIEGVAPRLFGLYALRPTDRRRMVERHQRRVDPTLRGRALRRRVQAVYRSYGRYYAESFRLPAISVEELDRRFSVDGYDNYVEAMAGDIGAIAVLPHVGSWEWMAYWLARVDGQQASAVVERLEPPALFDWFVEFRERIGLNIIALGPDAGRGVTHAIKEHQLVALLSDRDIAGGGIEVKFFGENTTLPAGPAVLALRTGAPLLPLALYDRPHGMHHVVVKPQLPVERQGSFREDVARVTQDIALVLEELIRAAPDQWHLLQPNWPSDRDTAPIQL
jgi:KDO2-lipid IV(A) lauroyltransferase